MTYRRLGIWNPQVLVAAWVFLDVVLCACASVKVIRQFYKGSIWGGGGDLQMPCLSLTKKQPAWGRGGYGKEREGRWWGEGQKQMANTLARRQGAQKGARRDGGMGGAELGGAALALTGG